MPLRELECLLEWLFLLMCFGPWEVFFAFGFKKRSDGHKGENCFYAFGSVLCLTCLLI